jgi:hypothetical protein
MEMQATYMTDLACPYVIHPVSSVALGGDSKICGTWSGFSSVGSLTICSPTLASSRSRSHEHEHSFCSSITSSSQSGLDTDKESLSQSSNLESAGGLSDRGTRRDVRTYINPIFDRIHSLSLLTMNLASSSISEARAHRLRYDVRPPTRSTTASRTDLSGFGADGWASRNSRRRALMALS